MAASMSPEQIDGWAAYDAAEPLGLSGLVAQMAKLLTLYMTAHGVETSDIKNMPGVQIDRETV